MCTYNGEAFLQEQIDSLLHQTYPNLEIIISDDASIDNTRSILNKYADHPHIEIFYQDKNLGLIENFEFAVTKTSGEYIAFCDQDDVWIPEKIMELYEHFPEDSLLIYCNSLLVDENKNSLNITTADLRNMYTGNDTRHFAFFNIVSGHTMMIKRALLQYCLPFSRVTYHDWWIAVMATIHSNIFYYNKVLQYYRQHTNTVTKNIKPKKIPSHTRTDRFNRFSMHLCFLEQISMIVKPEHKSFFSKLYNRYKAKTKGFSLALFIFLYRQQDIIYRFSKKNFMSRLTDIRKLARHETPM
jgi:glycosyltransferase involved in cell wall biosynthesis